VIGLAVTSGAKSPMAPDYPTVAETLPGFDVNSWFGVGVRAGTSKAIIDKLEADVIAVCKQEDVKKRLLTASIESVGSTAKDFAGYIALERKNWGQLITDLKIKID
jgi:tripartite-type tricarboxylate transporter receptor subunit TctC